jgi:hypothetical protein
MAQDNTGREKQDGPRNVPVGTDDPATRDLRGAGGTDLDKQGGSVGGVGLTGGGRGAAYRDDLLPEVDEK